MDKQSLFGNWFSYISEIKKWKYFHHNGEAGDPNLESDEVLPGYSSKLLKITGNRESRGKIARHSYSKPRGES